MSSRVGAWFQVSVTVTITRGGQMTDWIDDLVKLLNAHERQENEANRVRLLDNDLILSKGGEWFRGLSAAAEELAKELNAKLGATLGEVQFSSSGDTGFTVSNRGRFGATVSLSARLDLRGQQIQVTVTKKGTRYVGDGVAKTFVFSVEPQTNELRVKERGATATYEEGRTLAVALLRDAFTADMLRP